jgi:hypothetical protein
VKTGNGETMPSVYLSKTKESRVGTETFQMLPGYIYKRNIKTPNGGTIAGNRQTPETNFLDLLFVFWWCRGFNSEHYTGQALYHLNHTPSALFFFFCFSYFLGRVLCVLPGEPLPAVFLSTAPVTEMTGMHHPPSFY